MVSFVLVYSLLRLNPHGCRVQGALTWGGCGSGLASVAATVASANEVDNNLLQRTRLIMYVPRFPFRVQAALASHVFVCSCLLLVLCLARSADLQRAAVDCVCIVESHAYNDKPECDTYADTTHKQISVNVDTCVFSSSCVDSEDRQLPAQCNRLSRCRLCRAVLSILAL